VRKACEQKIRLPAIDYPFPDKNKTALLFFRMLFCDLPNSQGGFRLQAVVGLVTIPLPPVFNICYTHLMSSWWYFGLCYTHLMNREHVTVVNRLLTDTG
jgi:hypothetical protein